MCQRVIYTCKIKCTSERNLPQLTATCVFLSGWRRKQAASVGATGWSSLNAVGDSVGSRSHPACDQTALTLSRRQLRLCQLYPDHMASINAGVRLATEECQYQMEWRRWNCSSMSNSSAIESVAAAGTPIRCVTLLVYLPSSLPVFRSRLKTHLFRRSYS